MTRPYDPQQPRIGGTASDEGLVSVAAFEKVVALAIAFICGWLFAIWQEAHWIVSNTRGF